MKGPRRNAAEEPYQQILSRLAHIEHKVDSIDETNAFALRAEEEKHKGTLDKIFKKGKRRAQIYLAADGTRGVEEIARHLGMKTPNVSPQLRILREQGLLELVDASGRRDIYAKKTIDRSLRISMHLREKYNLMPNGRPNKASKRKR